MSGFNLSDKILDFDEKHPKHIVFPVVATENIREFIRLLKEALDGYGHMSKFRMSQIIDKLAGEKLIVPQEKPINATDAPEGVDSQDEYERPYSYEEPEDTSKDVCENCGNLPIAHTCDTQKFTKFKPKAEDGNG